ncbi:MAG: hypothetical protein E7496_03300 [Ruminococcus sp.]|nr:hypothetical protein [Ruminococcus sp.]
MYLKFRDKFSMKIHASAEDTLFRLQEAVKQNPELKGSPELFYIRLEYDSGAFYRNSFKPVMDLRILPVSQTECRILGDIHIHEIIFRFMILWLVFVLIGWLFSLFLLIFHKTVSEFLFLGIPMLLIGIFAPIGIFSVDAYRAVHLLETIFDVSAVHETKSNQH